MQRLVLVLVLAFGVAPSAFAQPAAPAPVEEPRRLDTMSQRDREREMQATQWQGPSGFWTSPHKSEHGAYRYRLMGIGAVLLLAMGLVTYRLIRRASASRAARS